MINLKSCKNHKPRQIKWEKIKGKSVHTYKCDNCKEVKKYSY